jgi:hypothetical protein
MKNTSLDQLIKVEGEPPLAVFKSRVFALGAASPSNRRMRSLATRQVFRARLGALVLLDQVAVARAAKH